MRIRSIRPEFWSSTDVAAMNWDTRLVYIGLWSYVDDNGVGRDLERLIVADLFPLDDDLPESSRRVTGALRYLSDHGHITRYEVDGKPFLHIVTWDKHQRIEKRSIGRYPLPTTENAQLREPSPTTPGALPEQSPTGEGEKGRRGEGEKGRRESATRARKLPDAWQPKPETVTAMTAELRNINLQQEHAKFADHYRANGKAMRDWDACWRNWMRRAVQYAPTTRTSRQQETDDLFAAAARRMGVAIEGEIA